MPEMADGFPGANAGDDYQTNGGIAQSIDTRPPYGYIRAVEAGGKVRGSISLGLTGIGPYIFPIQMRIGVISLRKEKCACPESKKIWYWALWRGIIYNLWHK